MDLTIDDLPDWERDLLRQVRDAQANEGRLYNELSAGFGASRLATSDARPTTKREAVAQFVDAAYALAASILQSPADFPAYAINYAIGLLDESFAYVKAEQAAMKGTDGAAR